MIPEIKDEIIETICVEIDKDNTTYARIAPNQPALHWQWVNAYVEIKELSGEGAAEAALRLALLTYMAINAQIEVNELEENNNEENT